MIRMTLSIRIGPKPPFRRRTLARSSSSPTNAECTWDFPHPRFLDHRFLGFMMDLALPTNCGCKKCRDLVASVKLDILSCCGKRDPGALLILVHLFAAHSRPIYIFLENGSTCTSKHRDDSTKE